MGTKIKTFFHNYFQDLRKIPSVALVLFVVTLVVMNILANKTIYQNDYIAIDGGVVITWIVILIGDLVTVTYGPKVCIKMNAFAIVINLLCSAIFSLVSHIPTSKDYSAFMEVLGGTWFIIISSTIAFLISSTLDSFMNYGIGKLFKDPLSRGAVRCRSYVSTVISAIIDNLIFNIFAFMVFAPIFWNGFHWTFVQCLCCSLLYGAIELAIEVVIFPLTYKLFTYLKNH